MVLCQSQQEKEEAIADNPIQLSFTEKRIWDMWRRWRLSDRTLWPWNYMTNNVTYADDIIDLECLESIVSRLEKQQEDYQSKLEQSKANRPNPNVRSLI